MKITQKQYNRILIAVGSNAGSTFGDPKATVSEVFHHLRKAGLSICAESRLFRSPAFPKGAGPDFVNAAVLAESPLPADEILALLHRIESDFGRERITRWGARTLDLDLISFQEEVLPNQAVFQHWVDLPLAEQKIKSPDQLILPHPRMQDRGFVLIPLADVAPNWLHPVFGKTVQQMVDGLSAEEWAEITPI